MRDSDRAFAGAIPDLYDRLMVPLLFAPYAEDLARRVATAGPRTVLEIAAGTGVVTRALAPLLAGDARYVVTDLNQPMLDHARARQASDRRLEWRQADATTLPFDDESFDAVCCQFGAMFFPDRVAGYGEAWRVLRPGGRFLFSVWDSIETNELADVVTEAVAGGFPDDPPRFLARVPHGYHDADRIRADVRAAGFDSVEVDTLTRDSVAPDAEQAAVAFCQGTPLRSEIEARIGSSLEEATARATRALAERFGSGRIAARMQAHVITAVK